MDFTKCPSCGSESKVVLDEVDNAIGAGEFPDGKKMAALEVQQVILDKGKLPKLLGIDTKRTAVVMRIDACKECGTLYCVNYEVGRVTIHSQMVQRTPPPINKPPLFGGNN